MSIPIKYLEKKVEQKIRIFCSSGKAATKKQLKAAIMENASLLNKLKRNDKTLFLAHDRVCILKELDENMLKKYKDFLQQVKKGDYICGPLIENIAEVPKVTKDTIAGMCKYLNRECESDFYVINIIKVYVRYYKEISTSEEEDIDIGERYPKELYCDFLVVSFQAGCIEDALSKINTLEELPDIVQKTEEGEEFCLSNHIVGKYIKLSWAVM